jgi:hypothetical protein
MVVTVAGVSWLRRIGSTGGIAMASKDKGGSKSSKKQASQTLKQKREAKKAKKAAGR